jgi:DNA-binding XRE family transcriptional regulator
MAAVYILCDPREDDQIKRVRYVGVSVDPGKRMVRHLAGMDTANVKGWLQRLAKVRLEPTMEVIEPCNWTSKGVCPVEIKWISFYEAMGADLLNVMRISRLPMTVIEPPARRAHESRRDNAYTGDLAVAFSLRLARARKAAGMSQEQLAEAAQLPCATIRAWERGDGRQVRADLVQAAARALGSRPGALLYGDP